MPISSMCLGTCPRQNLTSQFTVFIDVEPSVACPWCSQRAMQTFQDYAAPPSREEVNVGGKEVKSQWSLYPAHWCRDVVLRNCHAVRSS